MAKITGHEPAMPNGAYGQQTGTGLTIRQYYAGLAMQGLMADSVYAQMILDKVPSSMAADFLSEAAVESADSLIKKLNK